MWRDLCPHNVGNTCSGIHTHTHAVWSRQAQTTGTHVERVSEQAFIPALSSSMSKLSHSNFVCRFSVLAHFIRCVLPVPWLLKPFCVLKVSHSVAFVLFVCWPCYLERFVCLLCDLGMNSPKLACCLGRDVQLIWPFSTCPTHWLSYWVCASESKQVLPHLSKSTGRAGVCQSGQRSLYIFHSPEGALYVLMHACTCVCCCVHVGVCAKTFVNLGRWRGSRSGLCT